MFEQGLDSPSRDLEPETSEPQSAVIVIFGATGDLSHRKLFPALYNLERNGELAAGTRIVGFARRELDDDSFAASLRPSCAAACPSLPFDEAAWARLRERVRYFRGDVEDRAAYRRLALLLAESGMPRNVLFYLAVSPEHFAQATALLAEAGLGSAGGGAFYAAGSAARGFRRIVVEKPFGFDLAGARKLSAVLRASFDERDIFRIDHYLGKEAVQSLIYFRFCNTVFEPLWDRRYIDRVEIDLLETGGIGSRAGYYDKAGAARDMLQNHLLQLLCLVAMECPADLDPKSIRDAKVKVLKSIPDYRPEEFLARSVRGQYAAGIAADGTSLPDYLGEPRVAPGSRTETFVALRLEVDSWRFAGVPFVLRTGKALDRQASEVRIRFKRPPEDLFAEKYGDMPPNSLAIRIQPDSGFWLGFNSKAPGETRVEPNGLRFNYGDLDSRPAPAEERRPEAYERLISDALAGDSTLFIRSDEAEEAWRIVDGLERAWESGEGAPLVRYAAGSPGPALPEVPKLRADEGELSRSTCA